MKNLLLLLGSFLFFGFLTFSCGKVFAGTQGFEVGGSCYVWFWDNTGNLYTNNGTSPAYEHPELGADNTASITTNGHTMAQGVQYYYYKALKLYKWTGASWIVHWSTGNLAYEKDYWDGVVTPYMTDHQIPANSNPTSYWSSGPPDNCGAEPAVDCSSLAGNTLVLHFSSANYETANDFCWGDCEVDISGVAVEVSSNVVLDQVTITGQAAAATCEPSLEEREIDNCSEAESYCEEACKGLQASFECDNDTGDFTCGCTYPPYRRKYDPQSQEMKSDPDGDGLTNDDPSETDMDNNGTTDDQQTDPDGDGKTTSDKDSDNDGENNRGEFTWADQNADWGPHNGYGTDSDADGDGTSNCNDDDIDGDGIPNSQDPDMDGDGVANTADVDADGCNGVDGAGEGEEGDNASDADTNQDGEVTGDDPPAEGDEWPTEEEVDQGYGEVGENTYDGSIEGDFTDPDMQTRYQDYSDLTPLGTDIESSEVQLTDIDSCIDFPNPYNGQTEQFCFNIYASYWQAMGYVLVALTGFLCFRLIVWRY